jgi:flagellar biosynthetic protein FlhB
MAGDAEDKSEAPTPKRKQEAVNKGDLLQSKELGTALMLVAAAAWVRFLGPMFILSCENLLVSGLSFKRSALDDFDPAQAVLSLAAPALLPLALLFSLALLAAIATPAMLGSLGFRSGAFAPKGDRLNPLTGVKRIFGINGLLELGKSIAKVLLLGGIGYWFMSSHLAVITGLSTVEAQSGAAVIGNLFSVALLALAAGLLLIALIDVPAQIFQRSRRLRMSKEEVRQENKETEGSPELKRALKQRQYEVLSGSARTAVKSATVVITNPTHFAVALRYDRSKDAAPLVVARGRGETAQAIRALAAEGAVPVLEYPQLTRAIYYTSRAGHSVAEDLYVAVATVLAFVFRLDQAQAEGLDQPSVFVPEGHRFDEDGKLQA